jgi:C4-dicarboxylate-specific signal transduction histidine kinase
MKRDLKITEDAGLQFFGNAAASISHEIRNVLAIINEDAGLMEDLSIMAGKGRPLDPERVKTLAGKIRDQVLRGDGIVKSMSRFAHSVDREVEQVDLNEVLALVAELARHRAVMKGVTLEVKNSGEPIMITTRLFLLENLLWSCVNPAVESGQGHGSIQLIAEAAASGARIRIKGVAGISVSTRDDAFLKTIREEFLEDLGGDLTVDQNSGEMIIALSQKTL